MIKRIINYNIKRDILNISSLYKSDIILFSIIYLINIFIYGQKIFFFGLAPDDYTWFATPQIPETASWLGRWAESLFNHHLFRGPFLHILPYINSLVSLFLVTLAGYVTAIFLKRKDLYDIVIVTLLISATPFFAHSLLFNGITASHFGVLLGTIGIIFIYKSTYGWKFLGFFLLVFSIGTYQAVLQVLITIVLIKTILDILEAFSSKDILNIILNNLYYLTVILFAFFASFLVNYAYVLFHNLEFTDQMQNISESKSLSLYLKYLRDIYFYKAIKFQYFYNTYYFIYKVLFWVSILGILAKIIKSEKRGLQLFLSIIIIILIYLVTPAIVGLPHLISGYNMSVRAQYVVGWMTAGAFIFISISFKNIIYSVINIFIFFLIVLNIYYVNIFYYANARQFQKDVNIANQIVNRIRTHKNYNSEPVEFKIIGQKSFAVVGFHSNMQAFNMATPKRYEQMLKNYKTNWARYNILTYFTDFEFKYMDNKEYEVIENQLIQKGEKISSYPAKNSIFIKDNKVILFMDSTAINRSILMNKLIQGEPDIKDIFNIYIKNNTVFFYKKECNDRDIKNNFLLHVYPTNLTDLSKKNIKEGFDNFNFRFEQYGHRGYDGSCKIAVKLPSYEIKSIMIGQYYKNDINGINTTWSVNYKYKYGAIDDNRIY